VPCHIGREMLLHAVVILGEVGWDGGEHPTTSGVPVGVKQLPVWEGILKFSMPPFLQMSFLEA
jgi:hypothetical protein